MNLLSGEVPTAPRRPYRIEVLGPHAWIVLASILIATFAIQPSLEAGAWLWVIALFFVGMPHGAYDLEALRRSSAPFTWPATLRTMALYTSVMFACVGVLLMAPNFAMLAFLALTIHHFGLSDSVWTRHQSNPKLIDKLPAWGHGSVVIAAPLFFQTSAAWAPFKSIATMLGADTTPSTSTLQTAAAIVMILAAASLIHGTARLVKARRAKHAIQQATVLGLTLALAAFAPPLIAVGSYFITVHALGHCLTATKPPRSNAMTPAAANIAKVHTRSLPLLLPSIAIVLALTGLFQNEPDLPYRITLSFLLFCAVATLPHHMLWAGSSLLATDTSRFTTEPS